MGFRGFDSSIVLIQRGGILTSIADFRESLSQAMLVGTMLVGRLGVVISHVLLVNSNLNVNTCQTHTHTTELIHRNINLIYIYIYIYTHMSYYIYIYIYIYI